LFIAASIGSKNVHDNKLHERKQRRDR